MPLRPTVFAASSLALGARVAQDRLGVPLASVHLQPTMLRSVIDPPYLQGLFMPGWLPGWMKQAQYSPQSVEEQVCSLYAGTRGYLDGVGINDIGRFESSMLGELRSSKPELLAAIRDEGAISDTSEKALADYLDNFAKTFA